MRHWRDSRPRWTGSAGSNGATSTGTVAAPAWWLLAPRPRRWSCQTAPPSSRWSTTTASSAVWESLPMGLRSTPAPPIWTSRENGTIMWHWSEAALFKHKIYPSQLREGYIIFLQFFVRGVHEIFLFGSQFSTFFSTTGHIRVFSVFTSELVVTIDHSIIVVVAKLNRTFVL